MKRRIDDARRDPSVFVSFAIDDSSGRTLRQSTVHDELHHFLSTHSRALIELPRDHGKSVQVCGRILWELGQNPALRVKLVCATDVLAAERTRFLRDQIAHNRRVNLVFPHLAPSEPWAEDAFTVQRPATVIGPSVSAFGVGSGSTGARADLLVCDDIVDVRSMHCPGERRRVRDYFHNNLMNLLEPDGRFWGLCTPWHPDDLNSHLKRNPKYAVFRRAVGPNLEPVWPEKWPTSKLAERRLEIGEASFARGYRLITVSEGEGLIRPEWVQYWDAEPSREAFEYVVLAVDPAVSTKESADRSGCVVAGVCGTRSASDGVSESHPVAGAPGSRGVQILAAVARRVRTPDLIDLIDTLDRQWQPDVILFESNAAFAGIRDLIVHRTRFGAKVIGQATTRSKDARVSAASVAVQNGTVRLKRSAGIVDPSQRELFEELTTYPFGTHDDLADATAAAVEHLLNHPHPRVWV
jgi:predicted phage terminase large subunit-like protein